MTTLYLKSENCQIFKKLLKVLKSNHCEVGLFKEGLKYRNHEFEGIVYNTAFIDYPEINHIKIKNLDPKIEETKGLPVVEISF